MTVDDSVDMFWIEDPELIRNFIENKQDYEQLCTEVAYILGKRLRDNNIKYSSITYRTKKLESFLKKLKRKKYRNPFSEITDISGVRIVCLYRDDLHKIESVIQKEFNVLEKVDKIAEQGTDTFGYSAVHFVAKLGQRSTGARYDDLKDIAFEIQTRTILQDAWAIINHHLAYKQEADVPDSLKRRLNSLVGLFETADFTFEEIRNEREKYVQEVQNKKEDREAFLDQKIDLDTLNAYSEWKFPSLTIDGKNYISKLIKDLEKNKYRKLKDIDIVVNSTESSRKKVPPRLVPKDDAITQIRLALVLGDEDYMWSCHSKPISLSDVSKYSLYKDSETFNKEKIRDIT
jgi:ppGpp synthetase/RelA/SpoT-type nucleotidyltranferase